MSLRSRIGISFVILGFISPIFGLIVPLLGLSDTMTASLVAFFMVGGPEVFLIIGGALTGKEGVLLVKNRIKRMLGMPEGKFPAPKGQYYLAVFFMVLWFVSVIIPGYVPAIMEVPFIKENLLWICLGGDALFIVSIFFLGGNQMVTKIVQVFKWEQWELPPEKVAP